MSCIGDMGSKEADGRRVSLATALGNEGTGGAREEVSCFGFFTEIELLRLPALLLRREDDLEDQK